MRTRFAPVAILAGLTQVWACGEFVSDAPDDANLSASTDAGARGADASPPRADAPANTGGAFSCADPKLAGAIFCDDFSTGTTQGWVPVPATMPALVVRKTPDLLLRGNFDSPKAFFRHDFAAGTKALDIQFQLHVNAPSVGHAQVFALFPGSNRSVGFVLNGAALSLFSYDDGPGYKAGEVLLADARGDHVLRLVAVGASSWQFQLSVDGSPLVGASAILADLSVNADALAIAAGLIGGDAKGSVDYSIDNVLVR